LLRQNRYLAEWLRTSDTARNAFFLAARLMLDTGRADHLALAPGCDRARAAPTVRWGGAQGQGGI